MPRRNTSKPNPIHPGRLAPNQGRPGPRARSPLDAASSELDATIRQIRRLRGREERERTGTCYVEGARIVARALRAGFTIERGVVAPDLLSGDYGLSIAAELRRAGVPMVELSPPAFGSISFKESLQGIGAVVRTRFESLPDVDLTGTLGWVALDAVGNPGNLGAILRTCEAVGCAGIIALGDTVDPYHPAAVRASMGAVFDQRFARTSFAEFARWKRERGYPVIGTSGGAPREYREVAYHAPVVLLMGSERLGLADEQQAVCDQLVRIPMVGTVDSLNLAVATSVVLYEVFQQNRPAP
ncbi:MAG: TrmH family RNA methyltransferase [Chloroflexota bacterium]